MTHELTKIHKEIYNLCTKQAKKGNLIGFYVNTENLENIFKKMYPKDTNINVEINDTNITVHCKLNRKLNIIKIDPQ